MPVERRCPRCAYPDTRAWEFCPRCGEPSPHVFGVGGSRDERDFEELPHCPRCQHLDRRTWTYCPQCGYDITFDSRKFIAWALTIVLIIFCLSGVCNTWLP